MWELIVLIWSVVITVAVIVEGIYIWWLRGLLKETLNVSHETLKLTGRIIDHIAGHEEVYHKHNCNE